jgi:two-component system phosphate regulon response regulator PhoB
MEEFKILIVDDEVDLCEILQFNLQQEGFSTDYVLSSEQALKLELIQYDFFLLDIMMGEISGLELAKIIRRNPNLKEKPIIFLSAKASEKDILNGFENGADDYITKPFSVKEVVARIRVIQKRLQLKMETQNDFTYENLALIHRSKKITIDGQDIGLTKTEFEILNLLIRNQGKIFSREEILTQIWENVSEVGDRTVDVNVRRIRKKIGTYQNLIKTKSGYGYYFESKIEAKVKT